MKFWGLPYIIMAVLNASFAGAEEVKEPHIIKEAGKPVEVVLSNDKVILFRMSESLFPMSTTLTLAENSCAPKVGIKSAYNIPVVRRALVPVWKKHPTLQGKPVLNYETTDKRYEVYSSNSLKSRLSRSFEEGLERLVPSDDKGRTVRSFALKNPGTLSWIDCGSECKDVLPANASSILFWDENFETSNDEIIMTRRTRSPSINQMTSRLIQVGLKTDGQRIHILPPKKVLGLAFILPPGVSYQLQWMFQAKNIVDEDDPLCILKWDVDFTAIFNQFTTATESVTNPEKFDPTLLMDYTYDNNDETDVFLNSMFSISHWTGDRLQK